LAGPTDTTSHARPEPEPAPAAGRDRTGPARSLRSRLNGPLGAALIFAAAAALYLRPSLFGGDVLSPTGLLYEFWPWRLQHPPDLASFYNNFLSNSALQFTEWHRFARASLTAGSFPAWNPFVLGGAPFAANAQSGLFSPFELPQWILSFSYGLAVTAWLKVWFAAFGTYLLVRELRLSFWPAVLGGIAFAFCSFQVVWLSHPHTDVAPMLPWAIWLVERALTRRSARAGLALALPLGAAFLGGHPGTQIHLTIAVALYAIVRAATLRLRASALLPIGGGALLGLLLGAIALLPAALQVSGSTGHALRSAEASNLPLGSLFTIAFPDIFGRPSAHVLPNFNFSEQVIHAGVIGLLLAALALASRSRRRDQAAFLALAALGLLVAFGAPGFGWLFDHAPLLEGVRNERLILLPEFALAVLAAFGLERLLAEPRPRVELRWVLGLAAAVALVALALVGPSGRDASRTLRHFAEGTEFGDRGVVQLTSVVWFALLAAGFALVVLVRGRSRTWAIVLLAALVALDVGRFVSGYQAQGPEAQVVPAEPGVVKVLREVAGDGRMVAVGYQFPADSTMLYGLRDVRGEDPPDPPLAYGELWRLAERGPKSDGLVLHTLTPTSLKVLNVLGAHAIYLPPGNRPRSDSGLETAYDQFDGVIYRNTRAIPRAFVPARVLQVAPGAAARRTMLGDGFDARRDAVVQAPAVPAGEGSAAVTGDEYSTVRLHASMRRAGLVVLSESLRRGWSVEVDGRAARPVPVDTVWRGVRVPAGEHEVTWRYRTPGLVPGAVLSLLTGALMFVWGALLVWRARRRGRGRGRGRDPQGPRQVPA
jgi:hypothetical protein